jgi:hypothetical protein
MQDWNCRSVESRRLRVPRNRIIALTMKASSSFGSSWVPVAAKYPVPGLFRIGQDNRNELAQGVCPNYLSDKDDVRVEAVPSSSFFFKWTRIAARAAWVIPGIRWAWPKLAGRIASSLHLSSLERLGIPK